MRPIKKRVLTEAEKDQKRPCGGCTSCCTVLGVPELGKKQGEVCKHATEKGCGIYSTRPEVCRKYLCCWSRGWEILPGRTRPDVVKVIIDGDADISKDAPFPILVAREVEPGALNTMAAVLTLADLQKGAALMLLKFGAEAPSSFVGPANYLDIVKQRLNTGKW